MYESAKPYANRMHPCVLQKVVSFWMIYNASRCFDVTHRRVEDSLREWYQRNSLNNYPLELISHLVSGSGKILKF